MKRKVVRRAFARKKPKTFVSGLSKSRRKSVKKRKIVKHTIKDYQTGTSITKIDKRYKAKKPGVRTSKKGKTYYEHRRNRSDRHPAQKL